MIILSSRKLEKAIASNKLSQWNKVKYLILPAVLGAFSGPQYIIQPYFGERIPAFDGLVQSIAAILSAYFTYRGIKMCFQENEQIDGKMFFERFALLGVPPFFRAMVIFLPISIILWNVVRIYQAQVPFLYNHFVIVSSVFGPAITYSIFYMTKNSFSRLGQLIRKR